MMFKPKLLLVLEFLQYPNPSESLILEENSFLITVDYHYMKNKNVLMRHYEAYQAAQGDQKYPHHAKHITSKY